MLLFSIGLILLASAWLQPSAAVTLLACVAVLGIPWVVRRLRAPRAPRHVRSCVIACLVLAMLPLLLPSDAQELERRCLFGGTAAQTQTCLAAQRDTATHRLLLYWASLMLVGGVCVAFSFDNDRQNTSQVR